MVNSVVLVGRLTRDPELRKTNSGNSVASFTLAVDDSRKGPNGEKVTVYIGVTVWGKTGESTAKFVRKGSLVGVIGRLTQRKYTNKNNVEVTVTEVNASSVEFLEPKGANGAAGEGNGGEEFSQIDNDQESKNLEPIDIVDEDTPF